MLLGYAYNVLPYKAQSAVTTENIFFYLISGLKVFQLVRQVTEQYINDITQFYILYILEVIVYLNISKVILTFG